MREISSEEMRKIQLRILDVVTEFCDEHKIDYWLDSGTLLGAIRHKGFIPWDDDIDLGMLRPDYDKFIRSFNLKNDRYKAYSVENNENFYYPYLKVLDTQTVLYEMYENKNPISVNIDVFIYDNAPDDDAETEKMFKIRDKYTAWNRRRIYPKEKMSGSLFRRLSARAIKELIKVFPKNYFVKKIVSNSKKYVECETERVGNFTAISRVACSREVFREFTEAEFEGKTYKIPIGYDEWLTAFYGDYMQLPPEEKRKSTHSVKAYYKD